MWLSRFLCRKADVNFLMPPSPPTSDLSKGIVFHETYCTIMSIVNGHCIPPESVSTRSSCQQNHPLPYAAVSGSTGIGITPDPMHLGDAVCSSDITFSDSYRPRLHRWRRSFPRMVYDESLLGIRLAHSHKFSVSRAGASTSTHRGNRTTANSLVQREISDARRQVQSFE